MTRRITLLVVQSQLSHPRIFQDAQLPSESYLFTNIQDINKAATIITAVHPIITQFTPAQKPKTLSKITGYHYSISIKGLKLSSLSRARESLEKGIAKEINFSYSGLPNLLNELGWRVNTAVKLMRDLSFHTVVVILADSIILAIVK